MRIAAGHVTVLLGTEPERRRLVAMLTDTTGAGRDGGAARFRRVIASPALPVDKRIALLASATSRAATGGPVELVVIDRATDGLDAEQRRRFLDRLHAVAAGGPAVAVDDADPVAALAVADRALRISRRHGAVLEEVDRRPIPDVTTR